MLVAVLVLVGAYLTGSIPFGYLVGRFRGVNLFRVGSGNIGATNAGRVLGRPFGVLVFVLDFLKGAGPVAAVPLLDPEVAGAFGPVDALRVAVAAVAFLGHLFPVFLGFHGGKGVATGAGVICVLVPGPAAVAVATWVLVALISRFVSLASLVAGVALLIARFALTPNPFGTEPIIITAFVTVGFLIVVFKHRSNVQRLLKGTENRIDDGPKRRFLLRAIHLLALGFWFGGAGFFNFVAAPTIFESFKDVVANNPSDRTAGVTILSKESDQKTKDNLASALAGSAVGPIFPKYFTMQTICAVVALVTALPHLRSRQLHVVLLCLGLLTVLIGTPISEAVTEARLARFTADPAAEAAARAWFARIHLVSLALSFVTVLLAGASLALAAKAEPQDSVS